MCGVAAVYRFIFLTFAVLGWAFYELSGGNDFKPIERETAKAAPEIKLQPVVTVSRSDVTPAVQDLSPKPVVKTAAVRTSVPTTKRLVSVPAPTPETEQAKLGPKANASSGLVPMRTKKVSAISALNVPDVDPDFRRVNGDRVNMRNGPGTEYSVIGKLYLNDEVEILQDPGLGWVKLQVMESGRIGWMAARLLQKIDY